MLKAIVSMHIGRRAEQQDCILVDARVTQSSDQVEPVEIPIFSSPAILAVCDGVGGAPGGAQASRVACETLAGLTSQLGPSRADMLWLLERLQSRLETLCEPGSATTIAGVAIDGPKVLVFHAGDNRVYKIGPRGGRLLTMDHVGPSLSLDAAHPAAGRETTEFWTWSGVRPGLANRPPSSRLRGGNHHRRGVLRHMFRWPRRRQWSRKAAHLNANSG
jgi:serine/threonine protein phosphatase PrpC